MMFSQDGVLHVTTSERAALIGMANGDLVYDTTLKGLCRYRDAAWHWESAPLSGLISARPAAASVPLDTVYLCTDGGTLYVARPRPDAGAYWHTETLGPVEIATAGDAIVVNTLLKLVTGKYVTAGAGEAATAQAVSAAAADTDPVAIRRFGAWEVTPFTSLPTNSVVMSDASGLAVVQTASNTKLGLVTSGGADAPAQNVIMQVY